MKLTIVSIVITLLANIGLAWGDVSKNPDRYPSLGVDYTQTQMTLNLPNVSYSDNTFDIGSPSRQVQFNQMTFDFKAPISNLITIDFHGGPNSVQGLGVTEKGYSVGVSGRVYLPELQ